MRAILVSLFALALSGACAVAQEKAARPRPLQLPPPVLKGGVSVEEALQGRRSAREFAPGALELADVAQVLWAAQGITHAEGYRTAPSAGALYPLEVYLVAADVTGVPAGVYRYDAGEHGLVRVRTGDARAAVALAAHGQACVRGAPAVLVIAGVYARTAGKYGQRAQRYVHIEAGHAAQNVYLQAAARGLATVIVGAFDDDGVQEALGLPADHAPLALLPVGRRR